MSIVDDIRGTLAPPHPAGRPFILGGIIAILFGVMVGTWLVWLGVDRRFDSLRSDKRFRALLKRLNLDGFADREHRFAAQFGMQPAHFELAFGFGAAEGMRIEEEDRILTLPPSGVEAAESSPGDSAPGCRSRTPGRLRGPW